VGVGERRERGGHGIEIECDASGARVEDGRPNRIIIEFFFHLVDSVFLLLIRIDIDFKANRVY
jgi:hypothetical protein